MIRKLIAFATLATLPLAAPASPNGLAWDSVTKIVMNAAPASLQPGSFDADFAAAASVQQPEQNGGGIFNQMKQAMAMGQSMQQMMQYGFAARHYVAGSKERTDDLALQTATIVDCAARTITTLDLRRKTYRVVSMDQSSATSSGGGGGGPQAGATQDNTRIAISVANTALGGREVAGQSTNGFRSDMTITETTSSGQTQTQNGNLIAYYSSYSNPTPSCYDGSPVTGAHGPAMMTRYASVMRALALGGSDSRFSVKQSGPRLPVGQLSMYDAVTFGMQGQGATFVTERGNVRPINATDAAFAIPSDFTQQQ